MYLKKFMRKLVLFIHMLIFLQSCGFNMDTDKYSFDNFKSTPIWDLAKAVRADNTDLIMEILEDDRITSMIDLKDPKYNQTLLSLAIQDKKNKAFITLLKKGANPNKLLGKKMDATPFVDAIWNIEDCNLFYVETMLKYGANPNLEIKNPNPGYYFESSYPLIVAVKVGCIDLIKLLVNNGAKLNCFIRHEPTGLKEGVISSALYSDNMEALKYFVIEKKVQIPDTVMITGFEKSDKKFYNLREILSTDEYKYDSDNYGVKKNKSELRKFRDEVIEYLDKIGK